MRSSNGSLASDVFQLSALVYKDRGRSSIFYYCSQRVKENYPKHTGLILSIFKNIISNFAPSNPRQCSHLRYNIQTRLLNQIIAQCAHPPRLSIVVKSLLIATSPPMGRGRGSALFYPCLEPTQQLPLNTLFS